MLLFNHRIFINFRINISILFGARVGWYPFSKRKS
nr:MAG TPA: hypothetical protein [Caudoviricetes sp.]